MAGSGSGLQTPAATTWPGENGSQEIPEERRTWGALNSVRSRGFPPKRHACRPPGLPALGSTSPRPVLLSGGSSASPPQGSLSREILLSVCRSRVAHGEPRMWNQGALCIRSGASHCPPARRAKEGRRQAASSSSPPPRDPRCRGQPPGPVSPAGHLDASMATANLENQLHSAQKNLLFLQREHASTLKGLHAEIRRLQQHCTGTSSGDQGGGAAPGLPGL